MSLILRHASERHSREISFVILAESPSGIRACDTLNATLRQDRPSATLSETILPLRTDVRLSETGEYRFHIVPLRTLQSIWSVGVDFVPASPTNE